MPVYGPIKHVLFFFFVKTDISFRIVFSTQSNIYNGAFLPSYIFNTAKKEVFH